MGKKLICNWRSTQRRGAKNTRSLARARFITADFKVLLFDHIRERMKALAAQGAAIAPSPRTLAMEADVIV
jgi:3-hydroxyisobutyrate dehydrogenase-like beta-hydroxyacid dehydrogenase